MTPLELANVVWQEYRSLTTTGLNDLHPISRIRDLAARFGPDDIQVRNDAVELVYERTVEIRKANRAFAANPSPENFAKINELACSNITG